MCLSFWAVTDETCSYGSENWWECRMWEGKRTLRLIKICEIYCQVAESVVVFVSALHISQGEDTEIVGCLGCPAHSIWRTCLWQNKIKCGLICLMNQQDVWEVFSLSLLISPHSLGECLYQRVWTTNYGNKFTFPIVTKGVFTFLLKSKDCSTPHTHTHTHTHIVLQFFILYWKLLLSLS